MSTIPVFGADSRIAGVTIDRLATRNRRATDALAAGDARLEPRLCFGIHEPPS
jgi:hypothetical protein